MAGVEFLHEVMTWAFIDTQDYLNFERAMERYPTKFPYCLGMVLFFLWSDVWLAQDEDSGRRREQCVVSMELGPE